MNHLFFGFTAAFFTTFAFAPQVIKTIVTKSTAGISLTMYSMFIIGVSFWILYGYLVHDVAVFVANIITLFLASPVLIIAVINHKKNNKNHKPTI